MGRYIPNTDEEQKKMLEEIGFSSFEELFAQIPEKVRLKRELELPEGKSELEVQKAMTRLSEKNKVFPVMFRGAGAYRHFIPAIVRSVVSKETLVTAYTPYQAEMSQGILQSIYEFQTMVSDLTGMDIANASVYDGAAATAEAVAMCQEKKRKKAFISSLLQPETISTVKTYCHGNGMEVEIIPEKEGVTDIDFLKEKIDESTACVVIQNPNYFGIIEPAKEIGEVTHEVGAKYIMNVNPMSLGILKTPREYGADIAVGDGQPIGLPLSFGGPYLGFMACVENMTRKIPGRLVGKTVDKKGRIGYVLTLQAREQHIRREKASSNVCSNQALCALTVSVYLSAMGKEGLKNVAVQCMSKAHYMADELKKIGFGLEYGKEFFHEFVTVSDISSEKILTKLEENNILGGLPLDEKRILWCCTELNSKEDIDEVINILKEVK